jgi:type I restriction enzyme S subunit
MTANIRHNFIDWNIQKYVDNESHQLLIKSHCKKGQVLVTMAGEYLGRVAVYDKDFICSSNQAIAKVTVNKGENPYMISTFLNSKFGQNQINRFKTLTGQPNINMSLIKELLVPSFSTKICEEIESVIKKSEFKRNSSYEMYTNAEAILLQEIGLQNFQPTKEPVNVKNFKESFGVTKRLDAEYYQIKYEQIIDKIVSQKHDTLVNIVDISKSIEPGSNHYSDEVGFPFYRVSDYNKFGLSIPNKELTNSFVTENKDQIEKLKPNKGTILFSKDGSVGTAYLLREDLQGITSSAILHLQIKNTKEIIPEYLTLALNSKLVQMQAERDSGGSIILHWRKEEIEQVVVPIIKFKKQEQIAELVEESFKLKVESERLLVVAKTAVEIAIEVDEETALKFIKGNN